MVDVILGSLLFGGGTLFLLAISPVGRALAERIRRGGTGGPGAELHQLRDAQIALLEEVDALRRELADVQERLDFAERVFLNDRERARLAAPGDDRAR